VMTGNAAANFAGPAVVLSFIIAGLACTFAGLCYAELASTMPVSGSAYSYAYVTLGEVFAWVMGWLLLLEYGVAASTVASGWTGYVVSLLHDFGVIGAILLIGFWFTIWKGFRKLSKDTTLAPQEQGFFEGCAVALVSFMVAGFSGSSFTPVPEQSFLWLGIGLMFGVQARHARERAEAMPKPLPSTAIPRRTREFKGARI